MTLDEWVEKNVFLTEFKESVETHIEVCCPELPEENQKTLIRLILISLRQFIDRYSDELRLQLFEESIRESFRNREDAHLAEIAKLTKERDDYREALEKCFDDWGYGALENKHKKILAKYPRKK